MEETQKIELTFKDIELTKIDVKPGETLAVTVKSDDMDGSTISSLRKELGKAFPGVRVLIFGVGLNDDVKFTAVAEIKEAKVDTEISSCATGSYCVDCNCGKKEQHEK